jgi:hypothetical protein
MMIVPRKILLHGKVVDADGWWLYARNKVWELDPRGRLELRREFQLMGEEAGSRGENVVALSPLGDMVIQTGEREEAGVLGTRIEGMDGRLIKDFTETHKGYSSIKYSADGTWFVMSVAGAPGGCDGWFVMDRQGSLVRDHSGRKECIGQYSASADGECIGVNTHDKFLLIKKSGDIVSERSLEGFPETCAVSHDAGQFAYLNHLGNGKLVDLENGSEKSLLIGTTRGRKQVTFLDDGSLAISDGKKIFILKGQQPIRRIKSYVNSWISYLKNHGANIFLLNSSKTFSKLVLLNHAGGETGKIDFSVPPIGDLYWDGKWVVVAHGLGVRLFETVEVQ